MFNVRKTIFCGHSVFPIFSLADDVIAMYVTDYLVD